MRGRLERSQAIGNLDQQDRSLNFVAKIEGGEPGMKACFSLAAVRPGGSLSSRTAAATEGPKFSSISVSSTAVSSFRLWKAEESPL